MYKISPCHSARGEGGWVPGKHKQAGTWGPLKWGIHHPLGDLTLESLIFARGLRELNPMVSEHSLGAYYVSGADVT